MIKRRNVINEMAQLQGDYQAGKRSRLQRERRGLGGSGDAHYQSVAEFERIREFTRDMDRNDAVVGPFVDIAVTNQLQTGFSVQPNTGDEELNADLKARFSDWAGDAAQCDYTWERTFWQQCWYLFRQVYIDGDVFALLLDAGSIQLIESDRCASPSGSLSSPGASVVHGIELAERRKIAYHFTADPGAQRLSRPTTRRAAFDDAGNPVVLHVYNPKTVKRTTQTRGVSAFAPIFYRLGMYEDVQFATLVQRQVVSALAYFWERTAEYKGGKTTFARPRSDTVFSDDESDSSVEKIAPGAVLRGARGEKLNVLSPQIPGTDFFPHVKLILTEIGINIGVPLVMALMDASETNFSGWRGAVDMARMGFRVNQKWFTDRVLAPVWRWKLREWASLPPSEGGLGPAARTNPNLLRAIFTSPSWPYIQPQQDATANILKLESGQISPAQFAREQGFDWEDHAQEIVANWRFAILEAKRAAADINAQFPDDAQVHWRELLNIGVSEGMKSELVRAQVFADQNQEQPQ